VLKISRDFRPDIQALRGFAVIAVIAFHSYPAIFPAGYLGVDLFFVISGFVITPLIADVFSLDEGRFSPKIVFSKLKNFYIRRYFRLAPAIGMVFIIATPLITIFGDISLPRLLVSQLIFSLFFIGNIGAYKFAGDYFHPQVSNPFIHTWSLSLEEQIYVLLPAIFLLIYLVSRTSFRKKQLGIIFLLLAVVSLVCSIFPSTLNNLYAHFFVVPSALAFYSPLTRFWQFGAGALLWVASDKISPKTIRRFWADRLLIAIAFGALFFPIKWAGLVGQIVATTLGVFLIASLAFTRLPKRLFGLLCWMGDRSYSAYLLHLPILYLLQQSPGLITATGPVRFGFWLLSVTAILFLSNQLYARVETKHRITGSSEMPSRRRMSRVIVTFHLIPILVGCLAFTAWNSNYFGLIQKNNVTQEGQTFSKFCVRENFLRQFPCTFPSTSARTKKILLLGDSHAAQYSLDVWSIAGNLGYKVTFAGDFGGPIDPAPVINFASRIRPDVIIISKYWRNKNGQITPNVITSLDRLSKTTKLFIVLGQNPVYLASNSTVQAESLFTAILHGQNPNSQPELNFTKLDSSAELSGSLISNLARKSGWGFINVRKLFCPIGTCETRDSMGSYYSDSNHLSAHGAFKIRSPLLKLLTK
jgi:peptidoglycan/LPS O-acetylase OafA/YrhL